MKRWLRASLGASPKGEAVPQPTAGEHALDESYAQMQTNACLSGKVFRWLFVCLVGCLSFVVLLVGFSWAVMFGPGFTKEQTAHILVCDVKYGSRAKQKAIWHGDSILPLIQKESANFERLNQRSAFWTADVLGSIHTEKSREMLLNLYTRTNRMAKLTGAIGLLQQGAFPKPITTESFLVQTVKLDSPEADSPQRQKEAPLRHLAIVALGYSGDTNALPSLLAVLREPDRGWDYARYDYACQAVARIGSSEAIPVLEECLKSSDFRAVPFAFRALITLGDKQAVPLAIERIAPEHQYFKRRSVVPDLEKVTRKSYGYDRDAWRNWWKSAQASWEIPEKFRKPWDDQKPVW